MIPRSIAATFPAAVRARGDQYFSSRRVHISRASSDELVALVTGTAGYVVRLAPLDGDMVATCTCPYFYDQGRCKHIWATVRQADAEYKLEPILRGLDRNSAPRKRAPRNTSAERTRAMPEWKAMLESAREEMTHAPPRETSREARWPANRRITYVVDLAATWSKTGIVVEIVTEKQKRDGTWEAPSALHMTADAAQSSPDALDRQIAQMLMSAWSPTPYGEPARPSGFVLRRGAIQTTLALICETGRCRVRLAAGEPPIGPVAWDDGPPWLFRVRVIPETAKSEPGTPGGEGYIVDAVLTRDDDEMPISEPNILHSEGVLLARGALARFEHDGAFALVQSFRQKPRLDVTKPDLPALLETLYTLPRRPTLVLPPDVDVSESTSPPRLGVAILPDPTPYRTTHHGLSPFFLYGGVRVGETETSALVFDRDALVVYHRDSEYERAARERLLSLGARVEWHSTEHRNALVVHRKKLPELIVDLVGSGWRVEGDGAVYRSAGEPRATVSSGIDWFELSAGVRYGTIEVSLHELLEARRAGATTIDLPDGSRGVIPIDWLARLGPVVAGGAAVNGALRYARSQAAFLDALLATLPEADVDATFERARTELRAFDQVAPADPPTTFRGTLREYQREGLGWLHFLRKFGLGGCLADDMGLGKTVQVLALLDSRRDEAASGAVTARPSIVVVPRSLVFNWLREAERFAPRLRVMDYSGVGRRAESIDGNADVVITTYGTLRRDAAALAAIDFDYAILDEAQAIKTAGSASAKAARLLRARHRLVMTGTPIENRIEELWSLFEFLNPGMLGGSSSFAALARLGGSGHVGRDVLARALRPVILRRTKEQVARDLPARVEQTLSVELEGTQRTFYDGLLEAYRRSVLERVDRDGVGKSRMHILEALLRLRQAACHPALADPRKSSAPSAKLDALMPALSEVAAEGHKALVFSQFTSFLALLRARLDAAGARYEYLDGRVRDRQSRVDRFQEDPTCPLFLISLKAGGHGLNLTAADYVFILDPWWNPAVEAQAIDRAHRIGQTRQVMATRIVARDTIEDKILELQASKRALAEAILGQDQGLVSQIGREELEMLLG